MTGLTAERLAELKREDWPRFSLDHIQRETGLYNVQGRSGPIGRDLPKDAAEDLARVSGCTVEAVPLSPATRALLSAADNPDHAPIIGAYLRHFVPGDCPGCGYGMFGWGILHGSGACSCGWPGTLYHFILDDRELPELVCRATCNGVAVCGRPRGEHELVEETWFVVSTGEPSIHRELRCPSPTPPPGIRPPFTSRYHAPEIVTFQSLLWAHPVRGSSPMSAKSEAVAELKQAVDALEAVSDSLAGLDVPELGNLVSFADRRVAEAIRLLTKP